VARQGIYDTQGELFGYVDDDRVYNLDGALVGEIRRQKKRRAVYSLDGEKVWNLSGDGIFSPKWEPLGYLGSPYRDHDPEGYDFD
jgi:YD repeat-containing protein